MVIHWNWVQFQDLDIDAQYKMHTLRQQVFVVEQKCAYLDADGLDLNAWHLLGWKEKDLIAYLRVIPHLEHHLIKIGRIVTSPSVRRQGIGKLLMREVLERIPNTFGKVKIKMSSQLYLKKFYEEFGFQTVSEAYDEDGIPHIEMQLLEGQCLVHHF